MKRTIATALSSALFAGLLALAPAPVCADPTARELQQVQDVLDAYRLRPDQVQRLITVVVRYGPSILNESVPAGTLVRQAEPELRAVLDPSQYELLRLLEEEADRADDLGVSTVEDRRRWIQEAMKRMDHRSPDAWRQYLKGTVR